MEQGGIWTSVYQVQARDVDMRHKMRMDALAQCLQERAGEHAQHLGVGFHDMQKLGQFWVLHRMHISVSSFPQWWQSLSIETWVQETKGPFSYRNFAVKDQAGQLLVLASSLWTAIEKARMRPVRVGDRLSHVQIPQETVPTVDNPPKLSPIKDATSSSTHLVQYSDIDMLGHTNNVKYFAWVLDSYTKAWWESHDLQSLSINFIRETHWDDELEIYSRTQSKGESEAILHEIRRMEETVCVMQLEWKKRTA